MNKISCLNKFTSWSHDLHHDRPPVGRDKYQTNFLWYIDDNLISLTTTTRVCSFLV